MQVILTEEEYKKMKLNEIHAEFAKEVSAYIKKELKQNEGAMAFVVNELKAMAQKYEDSLKEAKL
jgi:hypothetical protein